MRLNVSCYLPPNSDKVGRSRQLIEALFRGERLLGELFATKLNYLTASSYLPPLSSPSLCSISLFLSSNRLLDIYCMGAAALDIFDGVLFEYIVEIETLVPPGSRAEWVTVSSGFCRSGVVALALMWQC